MTLETTTRDTTANGTGVAPQGPRPDLTIFSQPGSPAAEAFHTLRANLKFAATGDRPARTILLAEASASADRATIAANLAGALASAGDTTLLVDADLRRPSLHTLFGVANDRGVSTFLTGRDATLPAQVTGVSHLTLLPAGPTPADPASLLASDQFRALLTLAGESAEFVIVDAPPVTAVADALGIAAIVDGVLLIVRAGRTRRAAAQGAKEQLLRVGANLLGVVLTDAPLERGAYRY